MDFDFIEANSIEMFSRHEQEWRRFVKSAGYNHASDVTYTHVITHGNKAAINGTMKMPDKSGKVRDYAFRHFYELNKFKNGKIIEITSYVIEEGEAE